MHNFKIETASDLNKLDEFYSYLRLNCPEYSSDIRRIKQSIDFYVQNHSRYLVEYRRTRSATYAEQARKELEHINPILNIANELVIYVSLSR